MIAGLAKPMVDVVAGGTEFLEVSRLADAQERVVRLLAVEGVGLQPVLTAGDAVGARNSLDAEPARHEVGDHRLARRAEKA